MATPPIHLRISEDANDALKKVAAKFPEWSLAQLGNKLVLESCHAILSEEAPVFPTVDYIRRQLGLPTSQSTLESMVSRIEEAAATYNALFPKKSQAARRRAA